MPAPVKSVRDIRTISSRADRFANAYMAYMQITCLEMEKARKGRERATALQRLEMLNARLHQIEVEKAWLLEELARRDADATRQGEVRTSSAHRGVRVRY